jgi:hypothetical protein
MKKVLSFLSFFAFLFSINAQSLVLHQGSQPLTNNQELSFTIDVNTNILGAPTTSLKVENVSSDFIQVKVKKSIIDTVTGSVNAFCWGQCFTERVYLSPTPLVIDANGVDENSFYAEYWPNGFVGTTKIRYTFFVYEGSNEDYTDSASVIMNFVVTPASVEQYILSNSTLNNARPNPANNFTSIPYSLPNSFNGDAQIVVKNILGSTVFSENLNSNNGKVNVNTSEFDAGIYFYSLVVNSQTFYTKKLIVKRN